MPVQRSESSTDAGRLVATQSRRTGWSVAHQTLPAGLSTARPVAAPSPPTGSGRAGRTPARGPAGTHTVTYPHLRPGRTAELALHAPNAALLIDFDNVTLGIQSDLTKELRTLLNSDIIKGKVAVQRAYADWRRYPQYIAPLSASSIDLIFAPAFG